MTGRCALYLSEAVVGREEMTSKTPWDGGRRPAVRPPASPCSRTHFCSLDNAHCIEGEGLVEDAPSNVAISGSTELSHGSPSSHQDPYSACLAWRTVFTARSACSRSSLEWRREMLDPARNFTTGSHRVSAYSYMSIFFGFHLTVCLVSMRSIVGCRLSFVLGGVMTS